MSVATAIAIYFLIWWIMLFAVLPWGVQPQGDDGAPGTDPGAPRIAGVWQRLIWTTVVTTVIFAACAVVYYYRLITLDGLAKLFGTPF